MTVVAVALAVLLDVSDPSVARAQTSSDSIAVHRDGRFFIRNQPDGGASDIAFNYGRSQDIPITGDWDGDGTDEIGVVRNGRFLLRTNLDGGAADIAFNYGRSQDIPITGDWDGDGTDEVGVIRNGRFVLRTNLHGGAADIAFNYGRSQDTPITGDWDGNGRMPPASDGDDVVGDPSVEMLERGDDGAAVAELQRELRDSRYWVGATDGIFGLNTEHAVLAVQKAHGLTRDGIYGPATREALSDGSPPAARSTSGSVVEFDEDRQLLLLVEDGVTRWTFHASGGDESYYNSGGTTYWAETPNGTWDVYRQIDGWRTSHLGELYRPKYFHTDGIAVHGYTSVPAYAASHGCVRVGMDQMDWIWANGEMPIGRTVLVYGSP